MDAENLFSKITVYIANAKIIGLFSFMITFFLET
jgi:hypothetical protein